MTAKRVYIDKQTPSVYQGLTKAAAELREPHRIARYIEELAGTFHRFYDTCQILPKAGEQAQPIHTARLALADALFLNLLALLMHHFQAPARVADYFPEAILKEYTGPKEADQPPTPAPAG